MNNALCKSNVYKLSWAASNDQCNHGISHEIVCIVTPSTHHNRDQQCGQRSAQKNIPYQKPWPKTWPSWASKLLIRFRLVFNLFVGRISGCIFVAFWATPFRKGWKGCFPPPTKDSRCHHGTQARGLLHMSGWHDQYQFLDPTGNKMFVRGSCRNKQITLWCATKELPSSVHPGQHCAHKTTMMYLSAWESKDI